MTLIRFQSPLIHGAGSLDIKNIFNAPLNPYSSVDDNGNGLKIKLSSVGNQYFEIGSGTGKLTLNLTIEGEPPATAYQLLKNNKPTSDGSVSGAGNFSVNVPESSDRIIYKVAVTNDNGTSNSNGIIVQFVYPVYYGVVDQKPINTINNLSKLLVPKGKIVFDNINSNYQFFCFAYPQTYGDIRIIQGNDSDENNNDSTTWNYITAFEKDNISVNNIEYNIYYIDINALYDLYSFTINF